MSFSAHSLECDVPVGELIALLLGDPGDDPALLTHVESCPQCRDRLGCALKVLAVTLPMKGEGEEEPWHGRADPNETIINLFEAHKKIKV